MWKFLMHLLILGKVMTTTEANPFSCPVSKNTVQIITSCPKTEGEWKEAADRKNCSQYADQCDEPKKLVYHCVVNAYVNKTLEVCAIQQNIVGGFCAEYSELGNVIQLNYNRECGTFMPKPCPQFYLSSEAFKYPGCYKLVTPTKDSPANVSTNKSLEILVTVFAIVIVIVMTVIVIVVYLKRKEKCCFKRKGQVTEEELENCSNKEQHLPEYKHFTMTGQEVTEKDAENISNNGQQENCKQGKPLLIGNNDRSEHEEPETGSSIGT